MSRELKADNASLHSTPKLMTPWAMEKQYSVIYPHEVFSKFQEQLIVARDHCIIQGFFECEDTKIVTISSQSGKERVVEMNKSNMFGRCSCKFYESYGISCRHIIQVLRSEKQNEIPLVYIMKRWDKRCKRCALYEFFMPILLQYSSICYACFVTGNYYLMTKEPAR